MVLDANLFRRTTRRRTRRYSRIRRAACRSSLRRYQADEGLNGWRRLAKNTVVRDIRSPDRLLEQASLFLHRDFTKMPEGHRTVLAALHDSDEVLQGKRVMIVDDDVRNIFALTSLLEDRGMLVISHDNVATRSGICRPSRTSTSC